MWTSKCLSSLDVVGGRKNNGGGGSAEEKQETGREERLRLSLDELLGVSYKNGVDGFGGWRKSWNGAPPCVWRLPVVNARWLESPEAKYTAYFRYNHSVRAKGLRQKLTPKTRTTSFECRPRA